MTLSIPSTETNYSAELAKGIGTTETEIFIAGPLPKVTANGILAIDRGTKNFEVITYESINTSNNSITGCVRGLPPSGATLVGETEYSQPHSAKADISCVSTHYIYELLKTSVNLSIEEIENRQVQYQGMGNRVAQQMIGDLEDVVNALRTNLKNDFNGTIITVNNSLLTMAAKLSADLEAFAATQRLLTAVINSGDSATVDILGGPWLDGDTSREYAGVTGESATLNTTEYWELSAGSGSLVKQALKFTAGAFPIAKVVANPTEVTSITNYGPAYQVAAGGGSFDWSACTNFTYNADGLLSTFDDPDTTTWTLTYDGDGNVATVSDGTDTTTITRNADGQLTNIS